MHGIFIMLINFALGVRLAKAEIFGFIMCLVGVICMICDPTAERTDGQNISAKAYVMVAGSAIFGSLYFLMNAKNVSLFPVCILIFLLNAIMFVLSTVFAFI
jgi:drug/metabolite transporter (DMT)-like permease